MGPVKGLGLAWRNMEFLPALLLHFPSSAALCDCGGTRKPKPLQESAGEHFHSWPSSFHSQETSREQTSLGRVRSPVVTLALPATPPSYSCHSGLVREQLLYPGPCMGRYLRYFLCYRGNSDSEFGASVWSDGKVTAAGARGSWSVRAHCQEAECWCSALFQTVHHHPTTPPPQGNGATHSGWVFHLT